MNKVLAGLVVIGLSITFFYGFQWWNSTQAVEKVSEKEMETWTKSPVLKDEMKIVDGPQKEKARDRTHYTIDNDTYEEGQETGRLVIPQFEKGYKTYWGADESSLKQGVGMYVSQWTTTPDEKGHTVLSGHRETVFTKLGDVQKGESIFYEFEGKRYEYKVVKTWVTSEEDRTVIVDKQDPTLTLTTCYPFDFVGDAPERYILQAALISVREIESAA
ncbi:class D sortase [Halobacillus litoralis]|uniref:class D sortase n=1 Tax=Halobacillus litoralis TaxID=45668 RepID=UPI001CFCB8F9|nr:class D sortase [Halobacillus litoralis]